MRSGEIPQEWKNAKVTPIYKAGSETKHRKLSTNLPVVVRVFERLVYAQLYSFLLERNLDNDEIVGSLFIDLTKAFDSIDHQLCLGCHGSVQRP